MKSIIKIIVLFSLLSCVSAQPSFISSPPKISFYLGTGFYNPGLIGIDPDSNSIIPKMNLLDRNLLLDWGVKYMFYPNARVGYSQSFSFHSGTIGESNYFRTITFRELSIETFYFPWERVEINFMFAPMLNTGQIQLTAPASSADWDSFLKKLDEDNDNISLTVEGVMYKNWLGFSSMIGGRYYLTSSMSIEGRLGYYRNFYSRKNWKLEKSNVIGPKLSIKNLPVFQIFYVIGF